MTASEHVGRLSVAGVPLEAASLSLYLDESRVPYAEARATVALDAATVGVLDPRTSPPPRVHVAMHQRFGSSETLAAISSDYAGLTLADMGAVSGLLNINTGFEDIETDANLVSNPGFEVDATGWTGVGGTLVRSTTQAHTGTASGLLTPDGVTATVEAVVTAFGGVTAVDIYQFEAWLYSPTAHAVQLAVEWADSLGAVISTSTGAVTALPAAAWTKVSFTALSPTGTVTASPRVRMTGTPAVTDVLYVDDVDFDEEQVPGWTATSSAAVMSRTADQAHTGTYSGEVVRPIADNTPDFFSDNFALNRGVLFLVDLYAYTTGADSEVHVFIDFLDAAGAIVAIDTIDFGGFSLPPNQWTRFTGSAAAVPDDPSIVAASLRITPFVDATGGERLMFDDITVRYGRLNLGSLSAEYGRPYNAGGFRPSTRVRAALYLRARNIDHGAGTVELSAASGDALLMDYSLVSTVALTPGGSTIRDCCNMVLGHVLNTALPAGSTGSEVVETDALAWLPGEGAWSYLSGIIGMAGLRLWCDEVGHWHLEDPETVLAPGQLQSSELTATDLTDQISRDDELWADSAVVTYEWDDPTTGERRTRYDAAGVSGTRTITRTVNRPYPGAGLAAGMLRRARALGRVLGLSGVGDYSVRPYQPFQATMPDDTLHAGAVGAVTWSQPDDVMTVRTRDLLGITVNSYLYTPPGVAYDDVPAGVSYDEYIWEG